MNRINPCSDTYSALMWDVITNAHRYIPKPGDWVLDLGAHFGMFSLYCASRGCVVESYEPATIAFGELCHTAEVATEIKKGKINPINKAVWSSDGRMFLSLDPLTSAANKLATPSTEPCEFVQTVSLKTALRGRSWDCMKVDIEGAEWEVLTKASRRDLELIKFLTIEIHNNLLSKEQVDDLRALFSSSFRDVQRLPMFAAGIDTGADSALFCWR
jgi:FkbM family methyltransferase